MNKRRATDFELGAIFAANYFYELEGDVRPFEILKEIGAERINPLSVDVVERKLLREFQRKYHQHRPSSGQE